MITFGGVEDDSVHRLAEDADGRWVGGCILTVIAFWAGVIWLVTRWL
jgi:hypothetical protein